jgi:N-acetylglucosamine-6-sulfatase
MAPTILDIAGVPSEEWPEFFDGRSLLPEWKNLAVEDEAAVNREVINVEFWGSSITAAERYTRKFFDNTYKSLRLVGEKQGWLFSRWCTSNQTELYNTTADPYELYNLAINPSPEIRRVMDRLSGLLLVTKSCGRDTCRKPWEVLRAACEEAEVSNGVATFENLDQTPLSKSKHATFANLDEALDSKYDKFFASLPHFGFQRCLPMQKVDNEGPYFPAESEDLGRRYRGVEDGNADAVAEMSTLAAVFETGEHFGDESQRYASIEDLQLTARPLRDSEIGSTVQCREPDYCLDFYED